jgi:hypothetical protein
MAQARADSAHADSAQSDDTLGSVKRRKAPAPVANNIVIVAPARYSTSINRVEIDGQVFDLNDTSNSKSAPARGTAAKPQPTPLHQSGGTP